MINTAIGQKGVEGAKHLARGFPRLFCRQLEKDMWELAAGPQLDTYCREYSILETPKSESEMNCPEPTARNPSTYESSCLVPADSLTIAHACSHSWLTLARRAPQPRNASDVLTLALFGLQCNATRPRNHPKPRSCGEETMRESTSSLNLFLEEMTCQIMSYSIFINIFKAVRGSWSCYIFSFQFLSVWMIPEIVHLQWVRECIWNLPQVKFQRVLPRNRTWLDFHPQKWRF